ncbi:hypothetical protein D5086_016900 [Populus alba]|uniref:Uncharacterized protein n=1 Tax=Populus alba TaxID=43335 RepID=A0ACC4BVB1_POPAL
MEPFVLDGIITRLLEVRGKPGKQVQLSEAEIRQLCITSRDIFLKQPNLLELEAPIKICGDVHGQYSDLLKLLEYGGLPPRANYLFLGDYVDRGKQSLETICLLLAYKIKYPENFFLLRGNHECASVNRIYGFYDECKRRFNVRLWKVFTDCFNCLPVAALIDEKILCMHGGLSPDLRNLDQIRNLCRPTVVPETGLLCDLLWSDPSKDIQGVPGQSGKSLSSIVGIVDLGNHELYIIGDSDSRSPAVVLAEIFPARLRSTCHGISAASGKEGAIVGAFGSLYAVDGIGVRKILKIPGVVNFLCLMFTFLVLESKGKSLEELPGEAEQENGSTSESRQTVPVQPGFLFM